MAGQLLNPIFPVTPGEDVDWKNSCRLATAAVLPAYTGGGTNTLTAVANAALLVDGVAVAANDSILVKDEAGANQPNNGIYLVVDPGSGVTPYVLTRRDDADDSSDMTSGVTVYVSLGAANTNTTWTLSTPDPIVLNTTALTFVQTGAGAAFGVVGDYTSIDAGDAASAGGINRIARSDHQHAVNTAAPAGGIGAADAVGISTNLARADHVHGEPDLTAIEALAGTGIAVRSAANTWVQRAITGSSGVQVTNGDGVAGAPDIGTPSAALKRLTIPADSTLKGDVIGAATETAHTPLTFTAVGGWLQTARRTVRFRTMFNPPADNAADTWRVRLRLGAAGVGGVLIVDSLAFDLAANKGVYIEGLLQVMTTGGAGTFSSYCRLVNEAMGTVIETFLASGALDTTVDRDLTATGESSTASANQQMTLRQFEAEVMPA